MLLTPRPASTQLITSPADEDQTRKRRKNQSTKMNTTVLEKKVWRIAFVFFIIFLCSTAGLASYTMRDKVLKDSNVESSDVQKVSTMMFQYLVLLFY